MPTFDDYQTDLHHARKAREEAGKRVFRSQERLKRLRRVKQQLIRRVDSDGDEFAALLDREAEAVQVLDVNDADLRASLKDEGRLLGEFEQFTDPREHLSRLSDDYPLLLFPVRIEARFKRIENPAGGPQHQLWVRIFPDDCSVDTFDDMLSEAELRKAQNYWINIWKVGNAANPDVESFVDGKRRGAWRELMGVFNAGRAYWIKENYLPVNADEIPDRSNEAEKILVIPVEEMPGSAVQNALRDYWIAYLQANEDASQIDAAFATFVGDLGITLEAAREMIESHTPDNIDAQSDGAPPADVQVAFIRFPPSETQDSKLSDWSHSARVTTFPERFVLLGYQDNDSEPILNEIGLTIPDPLVVGPDPSMDVEAVLRTEFGPDFDDLSDDDKAEKYVEYLSTRAGTKWLFDFDEAVRVGMGFKVDISETVYKQGFTRLFVLGVKLSASKDTAQELLEELVQHHHFGDSGFSLLAQGTPTNNTDTSPSGYTDDEDAEALFDNYHRETETVEPMADTEKRDGRWLAELLGIRVDRSSLDLAVGYHGTDQCESRAMNTALWNATIGYFMESMLTPVFSDWQRNLTRWYLINFVSGRGYVPAVRIGDQPYGILPVSTVSDLGWLTQEDSPVLRGRSAFARGLDEINTVLQVIRTKVEGYLDQVAYVGADNDGDAHKLLLQILGLHANSVEFDQRYAESFAHHYNWFLALGATGEAIANYLEHNYKQRGLQLLQDHGYQHDFKLDPSIPILEKFFLTREHDVKKPLVDDRELSETEGIRAYTATGENYIEWLIEKAADSHQDIRNQRGFADNKAPYALLYDMLRHAVNLGFANTGLNLYQAAGVIDATQAGVLRMDADFIGISQQAGPLESKYDLIYRTDSRVATDGVLLVDHISDLVKTQIVNSQTAHLQDTLSSLQHLAHVPTARLERAFVEHLDLCTYRLDAWLLGLVNAQLHAMRYTAESAESTVREGIYLGAYGWLENLKADDATLTSASLDDDLSAIFDPDGTQPPMADDTNAGYIHAPSIDHGLTAAVLRNAYISTADEEDAESFKVNLSSERVRMALSIVEGMQQGQSLGALLGYQLERGLHDRTEQTMDSYIYELRKVFPLNSNKMVSTQIREGRAATDPDDAQRNQEEEDDFSGSRAIAKIEARNVVNGLALLDHVRRTANDSYPFGFEIGEGPDKLMAADGPRRAIIDSEVQRLMNIRDAVADLAMAESVHQVVQGNYERASGSLDAYSKGHYPQMPDVVRSPGSGVSLTHRFGIHLPSGAVPAAGDTPRAKAEPAINEWIENLLPDDLSKIACRVVYKIPSYDLNVAPATVQTTVSVTDLEISPIDLLYSIDIERDRSLSALDDHILYFIHKNGTPPPADIEVEIQYTHRYDTADNILSFFELAPLIDSLRSLVLSSRPLTAADISLQNEGSKTQNKTASIDRNRIADARNSILGILSDIQAQIITPLQPLFDVEDFEVTIGNSATILAQADSRTASFITHLRRLSLFGIPQSGFGFVNSRKQAIFAAVKQKIAGYRDRWRDRQVEYDDVIANELPGAGSDEDTIRILAKAERLISTNPTAEPDIATYQGIVDGKKSDFDDKLDELDSYLAGDFSTFDALLSQLSALVGNLGDFDAVPFDSESDIRQILVLVEDILKQCGQLHEHLTTRMDKVLGLLNDEFAAANADRKLKLMTEAAAILFGDDFRIVPKFTLGDKQGSELQKCRDDIAQLLDYQTTDQMTKYPLDDWLYGVARVREKMAAWENLVILAEGYKDRMPMNLTPIQLPYVENDHWLGLKYPDDFEIPSDKLLYTAYMPAFDPAGLHCGLLVDEWTEVIPAKQETTGLTFHYDQPNSEPPQAWLLMTPSEFTGEWQWSDLPKTLHETLDLAKLRAIEPDHIDRSEYAQLLPATVAAVTTHPVTMAMNYSMPADQVFELGGSSDV